MQQKKINKILFFFTLTNGFLVFLLGYIGVDIPTDMIENLVLGRNYNLNQKHPPLFMWESVFFTQVLGLNYFLLTPIHQSIMLIFVFLLANKIFKNPYKALLAVFLTSGIWFNVFIYKFNANTANIGLYACIYYFFYTSLAEKRYKLLPLVALLCSFALLIKLSAIILIASLGFVTLFTKEGRLALKSKFFYLGIVVFLAIIVPFFYKTLQMESNIFTYTSYQAFVKRRWYEELRFILMIILPCLPAIFALFYVKNKFVFVNSFEGKFLLILSVFPFVITFFFILTNKQIGAFWLMMYFQLPCIFFLYFTQTNSEKYLKAMISLAVYLAVVFAFFLIINILKPIIKKDEYTNFVESIIQKEGMPNYVACAERNIVACHSAIFYSSLYKNTKLININDVSKYDAIFIISSSQFSFKNKDSYTKTLQYSSNIPFIKKNIENNKKIFAKYAQGDTITITVLKTNI